MIDAVPAVLVAVLWVGGWTWRVRAGLLDQAPSRAYVVALWMMVALVPVASVILVISLAAD